MPHGARQATGIEYLGWFCVLCICALTCIFIGDLALAQSRPQSTAVSEDEEAARRFAEQKKREYEEHLRLVEEARAANAAILEQVRSRSICLAGTDTAFSSMKRLYDGFKVIRPDAPPNLFYNSGNDNLGISEMIAGRAEAALLREPLTQEQAKKLKAGFPNQKIEEIAYSKAVLVIVVHAQNAVPSLTFKQIADIYRGKITKWSDVGGGTGDITPVGTKYPALSWGMLVRRILGGRPVVIPLKLPTDRRPSPDDLAKAFDERAKTHPGGPYRQYRKDASVLREIAKDHNAIGYCLLPPSQKALKGVRLVSVIGPADPNAMAPTLANVFEGKYPLRSTVRFLVRPDASDVVKEFIAYACRRKAEGSIQSVGLIPMGQGLRVLEDRRLADMKSGKGVRISAAGVDGGPPPFRDLATEYVRAKAVVQLSYKPIYEDLPAIGDFVGGGAGMRELLFLADGPSARAMAVHGEKWKALGRDKDGKSDGTGPAEHVLAGRAVAVIVNPANKLSSLSLKQLRDIFGGKVKDWNAIGSTPSTGSGQAGLTTGGDGKSQIKRSQIKKSQIKAYGLRTDDPATAVFEKECLSRYKWGRVVARKDTAAAVAAVSMDPHAIAYVDLLAIPGLTPASLAGSFVAAGQNVKVLAIKPISQAAPVLPTPANIKSGTYALSQRLYVYVYPKASDTAKDFVKFIATCGASEATPYADTVQAVMKTYNKHNLIPLAPAAIQRITKEAQAAKAKAAKSKRKGK